MLNRIAMVDGYDAPALSFAGHSKRKKRRICRKANGQIKKCPTRRKKRR